MSRPGINPVEYTYGPPNSGSTASSIPHPEPISAAIYHIAGITTTVFGLSELPPGVTEVAVLWLLHPRLQTQACMAPFAAHLITSWNAHRSQGRRQTSNSKKGLIAVSFDQRNHGSREVSAIANEAWRQGNDQHAQDMFSSFNGTSVDTSLLIDYLGAYVFPADDIKIVQHVVLGISLGGHAAWHCLMRDSRISAAIVTIGCPDYIRVMSDRARLSKRKTWLGGQGRNFLGSVDFPWTLVEAVRKHDPVGLIWGNLERRRGQEHLHDDLTAEEKEKLTPLMVKCFGNKRILNLSGGSDKLVNYAHCKPFLDWLKKAIAKGGWFEGGGLYLEDVVFDGVGHGKLFLNVRGMVPCDRVGSPRCRMRPIILTLLHAHDL